MLIPVGIGLTVVWLLTHDADTSSRVSERDPNSKKIVFIAGAASHGPGEHEFYAGCKLLADHLDRSGLPLESVIVRNGWPKDESVLDGASALVIYVDGGPKHPVLSHLDTLKRLTADGVGVGCIHYALEVPEPVAGELFLESIGGYFATDWSVNPFWAPEFKPLPDHPITRGIGEIRLRDEWYFHMKFAEGMEQVFPILSALPPEQTLRRRDGPHSNNPHVRDAVLVRKEPQHLMWAHQRSGDLAASSGGRGFGFTGGHFHRNWKDDNQRRIVLNAIAWIAGLEVPMEGVASSTPSDREMLKHLDKDKPY